LRLLALTHTYPRYDGDTNGPFVRFLMDELASRGHELRVLTAWDPEFDPALLEPKKGRADLTTYRYAPFDSWHQLGYSRTIHADVKVKMKMLALAPLMMAAGRRRILKEAKAFKPDILQAHWFLPNAWIAASAARKLDIPLVATLHGSDVFVAEKGFPYSHMTRVAVKQVDLLTSCSPDLRDRICALGVKREYSHVIPYAADPVMVAAKPDVAKGTEVRERFFPQGKGFMIFALGRLVYKKGYEFLIRALPAVLLERPDTKLVIAGEGDLESELKNIVAELGLSHAVHFVGRLLRDAIPAYMNACDTFVMPSIRDSAGNIDGLPNVILEAMAAAKPVVATNVAGIPLAVRPELNGLLVPEKDAKALGTALLEAASDPERLLHWGRASRALVESELNWGAVADRYESVFEELLRRKA
jgi:glycosyltransferase involved in cell wall biosynthesis